jgi:hypothetical protein
MNRRVTGRTISASVLTVAVTLIVLPGLVVAGDRGRCHTAVVEESFRLPDGSVHPPGKVTVCATHKLSPVSHLNAIHVDGMAIGLHRSRRGVSEDVTTDAPFFMLLRDGQGQLHLAGYATPSRNGMVTYELMDVRARRQGRAPDLLAKAEPNILAMRIPAEVAD